MGNVIEIVKAANLCREGLNNLAIMSKLTNSHEQAKIFKSHYLDFEAKCKEGIMNDSVNITDIKEVNNFIYELDAIVILPTYVESAEITVLDFLYSIRKRVSDLLAYNEMTELELEVHLRSKMNMKGYR